MSDLRVSYTSFDVRPDTFVSQQLQIASVRVVGAESTEQIAALFNRHKQDITRFFRFCDQQHRLSGREYTQYRISLEGIELRYVNNNGQPVVYVTPSAVSSQLPSENVLPSRPILLDPPVVGWIGLSIGAYKDDVGQGGAEIEIYGLRSGFTITPEMTPVEGSLYKRANIIICFGDITPDGAEAWIRAQYTEPEAADEALAKYSEEVPPVYLTFPAIDGPAYLGEIQGYRTVPYGETNPTPGPVVVYPYAQPAFEMRLGARIRLQPAASSYVVEYFMPFLRRNTSRTSRGYVSAELHMVGPAYHNFKAVTDFSSVYNYLKIEQMGAPDEWDVISETEGSLTESQIQYQTVLDAPLYVPASLRIVYQAEVPGQPPVPRLIPPSPVVHFGPWDLSSGFKRQFSVDADVFDWVETQYSAVNLPRILEEDYTQDGMGLYMPTFGGGTPLP